MNSKKTLDFSAFLEFLCWKYYSASCSWRITMFSSLWPGSFPPFLADLEVEIRWPVPSTSCLNTVQAECLLGWGGFTLRWCRLTDVLSKAVRRALPSSPWAPSTPASVTYCSSQGRGWELAWSSSDRESKQPWSFRFHWHADKMQQHSGFSTSSYKNV